MMNRESNLYIKIHAFQLHMRVHAFQLWAKINYPEKTEENDNGEWCFCDKYDKLFSY